jgi:hypothetical protein
MSFDHIHLGAGRISIGAILPLAHAAGARTHVVAHAGSLLNDDASLLCRLVDEHGCREQPLELASLSCANTLAQLKAPALATLRDAPELLLTSALSAHGIDQQRDFVLALVRERAGKPTTFVACEDDVDPRHTTLLDQLERDGVTVRSSVVHCFCSRDTVASAEWCRAVRADAHRQWIIAGEPTDGPLQALASVDDIVFSPHVAQHARRARWLGEGPRLALVVFAADANQPALAPPEAEARTWLDGAYQALVPLTEAHCRDLPDTRAYAERMREQLLEHDGDTLDLLRDQLKRGNPCPFLRSLDRAVGEPARVLRLTTGTTPPALQRLVYDVGGVLGRLDCYSDRKIYEHDGDGVLDQQLDDLVLDAYHALLTGIFDSSGVDNLVERLGEELAHHRYGYG